MRKHLCIDARMCRAGGLGTFLNYISSYLLAKKNYRLSFLCNKETLPLYDQGEKIEFSGEPFSLREQYEFVKKIPYCDLFWSPFINIPLLPIKAKKRLVTVHDTYHLTYSKKFPFLHRFASKVFYNGAFFSAENIVTLSNFSKTEILKRSILKPKDVTVIPGGIDTNFFSRCIDRQKLDRVKQKYSLPSRFILALGNVKPHKNISSLLLAFEKLDHQMPGAYSLVIVGKKEGFKTNDDSLFKLFQEKNHLNKKVHFTGIIDQEDLPAVYTLASCFCFPSFYEGYGYPPLEAMACGCPVVASSKASIPEVCGKGALYIDPYNFNDLFQKIRKILLNENVRNSQIRYGTELMKQRDISLCREKFTELLEKVI